MALSPYISWLGHGTVCPTPPVSFTSCHAYAFGVNADRVALQALVDELLTPATQGLVKYTVPAGAALFTFNDVERCASTVDLVGWMPGRESAIWVLLIEESNNFPFLRPVLWSPYIFINLDLGLVPGREIWGWPKSIAQVTVATDQPSLPARFAVQTNVFQTFDPTLPGQSVELISVTGTAPLQQGGLVWPAAADVVWDVAETLLQGVDPLVLAQLVLHPVLPAIALKQFRDSLHPATVCFRALVNSPCRFTKFTSARLLTDDFTVTINNCASHAIIRDLFGIAPATATTNLPVVWAAALEFDFDAENGTTIVPPE